MTKTIEFKKLEPDYMFQTDVPGVKVLTKLYLKPGEDAFSFTERVNQERMIARYRAEQLAPTPKRTPRVYRDTEQDYIYDSFDAFDRD